MRIMFINNAGGGFADHIEIAERTTIGQLFQSKIGGKVTDYLIRVNRQPTTAEYILQPDDRVSITPVKIEGAKMRRALVTIRQALDGNCQRQAA